MLFGISGNQFDNNLSLHLGDIEASQHFGKGFVLVEVVKSRVVKME
jgi:hypothetical protein